MGLNKPVDFTTAKLLKEKGFDKPTLSCYDKCDMLSSYVETVFKPKNYNISGYLKSAPTIAEVVMWLYEKHGIWIQPTICNDKTFRVGCIELKNHPLVEHIVRNKNEQLYFNSPTEAYEAAIEYTLKHLI